MAGPTWTNPDQVTFLTKRLSDFVAAQNAKTLMTFWTNIWRDFFLQWPDPESELVSNGLDPTWHGSPKRVKKKKKTPEGVVASVIPPVETDVPKWLSLRRESIKNWYNNHGLNKGKRRAGKNHGITLALQPSAPRVLSERNMYSKLYYNDRVKAQVEAEIGDRKITRKDRFAITNRLLDEIYDQEPESVKVEIRKVIEVDRKAKEAERELSASVIAADEALGPKEYLKAQSSLPDIIGDFLEVIARRTGWSFTVIGGGPDGAKDGKIRTISLHTGQDGYGQTFPKAIPDYVETILVPYSKFLESVYPQSVRISFIPRADETSDTASVSMDASSPGKIPTPNASMGISNTPALSPETPKADVILPPTPSTSAPTQIVSAPSTTALEVPKSDAPSNMDVTSEDVSTPSIATLSAGAPGLGVSSATELYPFPTLMVPPDITGSALSGTMDVLPTTFNFDFSTPFQLAGENQIATNRYGNMFTGNQDLSYTHLLQMPLEGGGDTGGSFTGWDIPQMGQSAIGNWGSGNPFNGAWAMDMRSQMDATTTISNSALAIAPKPNDENPLKANNVGAVNKAPEVSITPGVSGEVGDEVQAASEVLNGADADVPITPDVQEKRTRKPAARGEIMPLTTKDAPVNLPEWFSLARTHLEDGLNVKEWKDCVETWVNMENTLGLSEVGSQCMNTKMRPEILSKWLTTRRFHSLPNVDDAGKYAEEWLSWWNNVQPKWRQSSETASLPLPLSVAKDKDDLVCLKKGGPSGLVTVMIGLKWWASIRDDMNWLAAVKDVRLCMEELMGGGKKRKGGDSEGGARKKKK